MRVPLYGGSPEFEIDPLEIEQLRTDIRSLSPSQLRRLFELLDKSERERERLAEEVAQMRASRAASRAATFDELAALREQLAQVNAELEHHRLAELERRAADAGHMDDGLTDGRS